MRLLGKKLVPDSLAPRSGILPSRSSRGLIGNRSLLRAVDNLLGIESVGGTPTEFDISAVIPVIDIRAAGKANPAPRFINVVGSIAGGLQTFRNIFQPLDQRLGVVLAAECRVIFSAPVASGNEISTTWSLAPDVPNGADELVGVSGYGNYSNSATGIVTNNVNTTYRSLLGGSLGGSGNAPWMGSQKGILWGQGFFAASSDPLCLILDVEYFIGNVSTNWPVGTTLDYRAWVLDLPEGQKILEI